MRKIALFGNPNTGKSSIFNRLTGLKQHVGNFPGVTVEKSSGTLTHEGQKAEIIDFPGTYSIYPRSLDEQVVYQVISNPQHPEYPDMALVVVDASNLERNLLLFTQIYDLGIPTILLLNMTDVAKRKNMIVDLEALQQAFPNTQILRTNARIGTGFPELKEALFAPKETQAPHLFGPNAEPCALNDAEGQSTDTTERFNRIKQLLTG